MNCPDCFSAEIVKNGVFKNGKQRYKCNYYGRQLVLNPQKGPISDETKTLIDKLLLERLPEAGIVRVTGISKHWLQYNDKYHHIPKIIKVKKKVKVV